MYVSPRIRAHKTFHLLFDHVEKLPDHIITEEVREWDYGEYEGLKPNEIQGIRPGWSIWTDGCPGGESAEEMCFRVDLVIEKVGSRQSVHIMFSDRHSQIREHHRKYFEEGITSRDVVIVAHGHFNRVFLARWNRFPLAFGTPLLPALNETLVDTPSGTHFNVEPAGVRSFLAMRK